MRNRSHNPSRTEAAKRVDKSPAALGHVESGRNFPAVNKIEVLLTYYGHQSRAGYFASLVERAKNRRHWWDEFPGELLPEWYELFLGFETSAVWMFVYSTQLVPELLQTTDYAEAVLRAAGPGSPDDEIATRLELRNRRRREVLDREEPCVLRCVIDEAALHREAGGPAVLREQLRRLAELTRRPNIEIRVLSSAAGAPASPDGGFTLMTMPPELEGHPGAAFVGTVVEGAFFEKAQQVDIFRDKSDRLWEQALTSEHSRAFIDDLAAGPD